MAEVKEAVVVKLPPAVTDGKMSLERAIAERRSVREYGPEPVTLEEVAQLLWAAQGITKPPRDRAAPSAGATFPLEVYVVAGKVTGLPAGLYRYKPMTHELHLVVAGDLREKLAHACLSQGFVELAPVSVVLAAVVSRTNTRYGERAVRYVHQETGFAGENLHLQAVALGLGTVVVGAFVDDEVADVLLLPPDEGPLLVFPVGRR